MPALPPIIRRHRRALMIGLPLAAAVLIGGALLARRPGAQAAAPKEPPPLEFTSAEVVHLERRSLRQSLPVTGSLDAANRVTVRAKVSAEVRALLVREGDRVSAGQVLAQIDTTDIDAKVLQQEGAVEAARATAAQSARNRETNKGLLAKGFISQNAYDAIDATHAANVGQLRSAEGALSLARNALRDARVLAPISGVVAKRYVQSGEKVAFDAPLVAIVDLRRLELQALVPADEVPRVRVGATAELHVDGFDAKGFVGKVERIAPSTEPGTRSVLVVVAVTNPDEQLKAGMFATGQIELERSAAVASLPADAVQTANGMQHVWLIADGKLVKRSVRVGRVDEAARRVEILGGLDERDLVLGARFDNLREGALAKVKPQAASMPAANPPAAATAVAKG